MDSAKGKTKKAVFSPCCGDETAHALTGPNLFLKAAPQKMVDVFFLKLQRNNRQNALAVDSARGKLKRLYFHRVVEMKQPHALTGANLFLKATPQKMVDVFFLEVPKE